MIIPSLQMKKLRLRKGLAISLVCPGTGVPAASAGPHFPWVPKSPELRVPDPPVPLMLRDPWKNLELAQLS